MAPTFRAVFATIAGHHAALTLLGCKDLDPWEVNIIADKAPPHESV